MDYRKRPTLRLRVLTSIPQNLGSLDFALLDSPKTLRFARTEQRI